jgi:hypothetical protein
MTAHHCKLSAPATGLEFNHLSAGLAVLDALKESKSSKYLFLVTEGCVPKI